MSALTGFGTAITEQNLKIKLLRERLKVGKRRMQVGGREGGREREREGNKELL